MKPDVKLPRLYVEGEQDCRVICELLNTLGTEVDKYYGPVIVEPQGSCSELLNKFIAVFNAAQSFDRPVGFVLDWDREEDGRDRQIRSKLKDLGCELTDDEFKEDGIIKEIGGIKVGIWLMPNSAARSGKLEDFLREMISETDAIFPMAQAYVDDVKASITGSFRFRDIDREKAELYSWLAVQKNPGESYALAIRSRLFSVDTPLAKRFHDWFCRLYGLSSVVGDR